MPERFQAAIVSRIASKVASEADRRGRREPASNSVETCRKAWHSGVKFLRFRDAALVATQ
jgi:hypothetical protein